MQVPSSAPHGTAAWLPSYRCKRHFEVFLSSQDRTCSHTSQKQTLFTFEPPKPTWRNNTTNRCICSNSTRFLLLWLVSVSSTVPVEAQDWILTRPLDAALLAPVSKVVCQTFRMYPAKSVVLLPRGRKVKPLCSPHDGHRLYPFMKDTFNFHIVGKTVGFEPTFPLHPAVYEKCALIFALSNLWSLRWW